jgi:flagellar basal-body rod modification protein FlgD
MATQSLSPLATFAASAAPRATSSSSSSSTTSLDGLAPNEQMFLQLLVAQIKNQDPLNPSDGTQFVSELAQFSDLEQTIAIRQDADAMTEVIAPSTSTTSAT